MKKLKVWLTIILFTGLFVLSAKVISATDCNETTICGDECTYGGTSYETIIIGSQCWFKQNLNVGTMIGNLETPDDTAPTPNSPNSVQKWCFNDVLDNCVNEGGLYTWAETYGLSNYCNLTTCEIPTSNQGICPTGWHLPTDAEFYVLENYLTSEGQICDPLRLGWGCLGAGSKLVLGGISGFDAISAGNHETHGATSFFDKREPSIHFWSSSFYSVGLPIVRSIVSSDSNNMVDRGFTHRISDGLSVRCLSNRLVVGPPTNKDACKNGGWKTFNSPVFKNQGDCVSWVQSSENAIGNKKDN